MSYIGWDGQEYIDGELDAMRRDAKEERAGVFELEGGGTIEVTAETIVGSIDHEGAVIPIPYTRSHGPIRVEVINGRHGKLLTLDHIVDLLDAMTPDELRQFQADMQQIIDAYWEVVATRKKFEL